MLITKKEIEKLFDLVLNKMTLDNVSEVDISVDEYWIITSKDWQNFEHDPKPGVGSLIEDVNFLKQSIENNEIHSYSDFDRLASILRAISESQAPTN